VLTIPIFALHFIFIFYTRSTWQSGNGISRMHAWSVFWKTLFISFLH